MCAFDCFCLRYCIVFLCTGASQGKHEDILLQLQQMQARLDMSDAVRRESLGLTVSSAHLTTSGKCEYTYWAAMTSMCGFVFNIFVCTRL